MVILLKRPNPGDHHGDDAEEVLRELQEQNMKQAKYEFFRQPGTSGIVLSNQNHKLAEVASVNGYVEGYGLDEEEARDNRSTVQYPYVVTREVPSDTTYLSIVRDEVKRFRVAQ